MPLSKDAQNAKVNSWQVGWLANAWCTFMGEPCFCATISSVSNTKQQLVGYVHSTSHVRSISLGSVY